MKAKLRKLHIVFISVTAVLLVLAIALTIAANIPALKSIAYTYVGRGRGQARSAGGHRKLGYKLL